MRYLLLSLICVSPLAGQSALHYRTLQPGTDFEEFSTQVRALSEAEPVSCRTSARTAELMECGVSIPAVDGGNDPYIAVYIIAGQIAMLSVVDSGTPGLVDRWRGEMQTTFGPSTSARTAMEEWVDGESVARLTWRGTQSKQWISLTIIHEPTMARILEYMIRRSSTEKP